MSANHETTYLGYRILIGEEKMRFTARVSRDGGMVSHDGHNSAVWASASCGSYDRAIQVAKNAIDTGQIQ